MNTWLGTSRPENKSKMINLDRFSADKAKERSAICEEPKLKAMKYTSLKLIQEACDRGEYQTTISFDSERDLKHVQNVLDNMGYMTVCISRTPPPPPPRDHRGLVNPTKLNNKRFKLLVSW